MSRSRSTSSMDSAPSTVASSSCLLSSAPLDSPPSAHQTQQDSTPPASRTRAASPMLMETRSNTQLDTCRSTAAMSTRSRSRSSPTDTRTDDRPRSSTPLDITADRTGENRRHPSPRGWNSCPTPQFDGTSWPEAISSRDNNNVIKEDS